MPDEAPTGLGSDERSSVVNTQCTVIEMLSRASVSKSARNSTKASTDHGIEAATVQPVDSRVLCREALDDLLANVMPMPAEWVSDALIADFLARVTELHTAVRSHPNVV